MNLLEVVSVVAFVAIVGGGWLRDRLASEPDPVEELKRRRANDELSQDEFERRLEVVLDDENDRIRACVEPVPGIGPERSRYIAERYRSVEELRAASREELEGLPEIGEQRAAAIKERLS